MSDSSIQAHKDIAVQFLQLVVAGRIDEGFAAFVDMGGQHHNAYFAAGFPALKQAMIENHIQFPIKHLTINRVLGDGDFVAVHSNVVLTPGTKGLAVVHIFLFQADKIVELWDVGQVVPEDSPNADGMF